MRSTSHKGDSRLYSVDQEKLQNDVQPSKVDEEMLPKNSYDIQPSDGDREGHLIKEQNSIYERQPRKTNKVPDTQDMDKQPRKKDNVQPLDVNQQRPPPMEAQDGVQLPEVLKPPFSLQAASGGSQKWRERHQKWGWMASFQTSFRRSLLRHDRATAEEKDS